MARARVQLKEGQTCVVAGRRWVVNKPVILTDEKDIASYRANGRFAVTDLAEPAKKKAAPKEKGNKPDGSGKSSGGSEKTGKKGDDNKGGSE